MRKRCRLLGSFSQWAAIALCTGLGFALVLFVDLTPEIEGDFFFSSSDPQARNSARIEKEFGAAPQVFIAVRSSELVSRRYLLRLRALTSDLENVKGVADARSITHGPEEPEKIAERDPQAVFQDLAKSPFWSRLLLAPDRSASFVVLRLNGKDHRATVSGIDRVLTRHAASGFKLGASGVPYVAEHIRRQLTSELQRFSVAAFVAFAILITLLFRIDSNRGAGFHLVARCQSPWVCKPDLCSGQTVTPIRHFRSDCCGAGDDLRLHAVPSISARGAGGCRSR
jgi:predicted RND superfamily exporter protein